MRVTVTPTLSLFGDPVYILKENGQRLQRNIVLPYRTVTYGWLVGYNFLARKTSRVSGISKTVVCTEDKRSNHLQLSCLASRGPKQTTVHLRTGSRPPREALQGARKPNQPASHAQRRQGGAAAGRGTGSSAHQRCLELRWLADVPAGPPRQAPQPLLRLWPQDGAATTDRKGDCGPLEPLSPARYRSDRFAFPSFKAVSPASAATHLLRAVLCRPRGPSEGRGNSSRPQLRTSPRSSRP